MRRKSGYSIAFMSDTHTGANTLNLTNADLVAAWLWERDPQPVACVFGGDLNIREWGTDYDFRDWLNDIGWPDSIEVLPVIGNHDTLYSTTMDPLSFTEGQHPHRKVMSAFPHLFQESRGWYSWSRPDLDVQITVGLNLVDTDDALYLNCNPPGSGDGPNPDYSEFGIEGSAQQVFLENAMNSGHGWQFLAVHRPIYAPFPASGVGRPTLRAPRTGLIRRMVRKGLSALLQGDQHIRFAGVKYRSPSDDDTPEAIGIVPDRRGVGVWPFVTSGGFSTRAIDLSELPGEDEGTHYLWAEGQALDKAAAAFLFEFDGDACTVTAAQCKDGETVDEEAFTGTIWRNPAADYQRTVRVNVGVPIAMRRFMDTYTAAPNLLAESEAVTAPGACDISVYRTAVTSSGAGSAALTIGDGTGAIVGQRKLIELADLVEDGDVVALDHANWESSAGVALTALELDDAGEFVLGEWTGSKWRVIHSSATVTEEGE